MDKGHLTRRGLTTRLAAAVSPSSSADGTCGDGIWAVLVQELWAAEQVQRLAIAGLAEAEQRFFAPNSYLEAQRTEMAAGEALEVIHRRIAMIPASTKHRLAIKVRLLATACSIDLDARTICAGEDDDLISCLIRSLMADLSDEG
jgi:hypothetical protein